MDLVAALAAADGMTCFVGAGGKKSTMYRLAERLPRAVVTATVRIPIFDDEVAIVEVTDTPGVAIRDAQTWPLGVVPARDGPDRYRGYDPGVIDDIVTDVPLLVKADGARMRRFKAPGDHEPRIPSAADTVVPVVSAHVVGERLDDERVHRVERVARLADVEPGVTITPALVGRILAHPEGGRKDVPDGARTIPLVNMVDGEPDRRAARAIADALRTEPGIDRIVLASMRRADPVVDVIDASSSF